MRILGIDPGTRIAGYGIVDILIEKNSKNLQMKAVAAGAWHLNSKKELAFRLATLAVEFKKIVENYKPTRMCLELSFLADNPRTALFLGHARGVILSEAQQSGLQISEISATSAKKIITGNGRADKVSIARMMSAMLGFSLNALPFDATDALAIACADAIREKQNKIEELQTNSFHSVEQKELLLEWKNGKKKKGKWELPVSNVG